MNSKEPYDSKSSSNANPVWLCGSPVHWNKLNRALDGHNLLTDPAALISGGGTGGLITIPLATVFIFSAFHATQILDSVPAWGASALMAFFINHSVIDSIGLPLRDAKEKLLRKESAKWLWACAGGSESQQMDGSLNRQGDGLYTLADALIKSGEFRSGLQSSETEIEFLRMAHRDRTQSMVLENKDLEFSKKEKFLLLVAINCARFERQCEKAWEFVRAPMSYRKNQRALREKINERQWLVQNELVKLPAFAGAMARLEGLEIQEAMVPVNVQKDTPDNTNLEAPTGYGPKVRRL